MSGKQQSYTHLSISGFLCLLLLGFPQCLLLSLGILAFPLCLAGIPEIGEYGPRSLGGGTSNAATAIITVDDLSQGGAKLINAGFRADLSKIGIENWGWR